MKLALLVIALVGILITFVARERDQSLGYPTTERLTPVSQTFVYNVPVIASEPPATPLAIPEIPVPVAWIYAPVPEVPVVAAAIGAPHELSAPAKVAPQSCYDNPDRYNWQKYALLVGFPADVMPELQKIINVESGGGDLCAINQKSGASCWIQQLPGGEQFFDPYTCMSQGYAKWLDGGRSFYRHWYQWWGQ